MNKSAEETFMEELLNSIGNEKKPENVLLFAHSCLELSTCMLAASQMPENIFLRLISENYNPRSENLLWKIEDLASLKPVDQNQSALRSQELFKFVLSEKELDLNTKATIILGLALAGFKSLGISKKQILSISQKMRSFSEPEQTGSRKTEPQQNERS